mmetsp:Transcript_18555/g.46718  ORF Transcript_18555/g.46718 Transcript_18555/m.46718 type:complete len:217 (-) Transcript_18555:466-1116(-)
MVQADLPQNRAHLLKEPVADLPFLQTAFLQEREAKVPPVELRRGFSIAQFPMSVTVFLCDIGERRRGRVTHFVSRKEAYEVCALVQQLLTKTDQKATVFLGEKSDLQKKNLQVLEKEICEKMITRGWGASLFPDSLFYREGDQFGNQTKEPRQYSFGHKIASDIVRGSCERRRHQRREVLFLAFGFVFHQGVGKRVEMIFICFGRKEIFPRTDNWL